MAGTIAITSGKSEAGRTTVAANLGIALALQGARVLLIDATAPPQTAQPPADLAGLMSASTLQHTEIFDLASRRRAGANALPKDRFLPNLRLLCPKNAHASQTIQRLIFDLCQRLSPDFDYILLDSPMMTESGFDVAMRAADQAILVVTPQIESICPAAKIAALLPAFGTLGALVVNKSSECLVQKFRQHAPQEVAQLLRLPLACAVPQDDLICAYAQLQREARHRFNKAFATLVCYLESAKIPKSNILYGIN